MSSKEVINIILNFVAYPEEHFTIIYFMDKP